MNTRFLLSIDYVAQKLMFKSYIFCVVMFTQDYVITENFSLYLMLLEVMYT